MPAVEQAARIVELWRSRPKTQRTSEDVLVFYGWLSEHEPALVPGGEGKGGSYRLLREILKEQMLDPE